MKKKTLERLLITFGAPTVAEAAPPTLPKTGSELPLFGLLGALSLLSALGLRVIRKTV